jgi:hypothetical protein
VRAASAPPKNLNLSIQTASDGRFLPIEQSRICLYKAGKSFRMVFQTISKSNFFIAMRNTVAHGIHDLPRNAIIGRSKSCIYPQYFVGGLANDLNVSNHGILNQLAAQKPQFVHVRRMPFDALYGTQNMFQIV